MKAKTVLVCVGTRPEIIKIAPLYHALCKQVGLKTILLHSGQHDELAERLYAFFDIVPEHRIQLTRKSQTLGHLFALLMERFDSLFKEVRPDAVLVQGDTSTALAGALTASYHRCRLGHVEAGLRSFAEYEPFPEEKNRQLISHLAHWHFAPTARARRNLEQENISTRRIYQVGNTVVDAVEWARQHLADAGPRADAELAPIFDWIDANDGAKRLVLVTAHRRESWDGNIASIARAVHDAAARLPELHFVWPVHPNPVVKNAVHETLQGLDSGPRRQIILTDPVSYPTLIWMLERAWLVLTDSGGIQEESVTLQVPVLVLRDRTERPEVIEAHAGLLIGTQTGAIVNGIESLHGDPDYYASFKCAQNPFGDGHAAQRIAGILTQKLVA